MLPRLLNLLPHQIFRDIGEELPPIAGPRIGVAGWQFVFVGDEEVVFLGIDLDSDVAGMTQSSIPCSPATRAGSLCIIEDRGVADGTGHESLLVTSGLNSLGC